MNSSQRRKSICDKWQYLGKNSSDSSLGGEFMKKVLALVVALFLTLLALPGAVTALELSDDLVIQEYKPSAEAWPRFEPNG